MSPKNVAALHTRRWPRRRLISLVTGVLLAASVSAAEAAQSPGIITPAHPTRYMVYVPNMFANTVSVIDASTNSTVATVPVGGNAYTTLVTADDTQVFVGDSSGVSIISTLTNKVTRTLPTGVGSFGFAADPSGAFVYVSDCISQTVSVISTATDTVVATVPIGGEPLKVAVNHAGTKLYVTEMQDFMTVVDLPSNTIDTVINLDSDWNYGLAISPDDTKVYVASHFSRGDYGPLAGVGVVDTLSNTVSGVAVLGQSLDPYDLALTPDGAKAYISTAGADTVSVLDTSTLTVAASIPGFNNPGGIAINPGGTAAYVANRDSNTVSVLDLATNTVTASIGGFSYPGYLSMPPRYLFTGFYWPISASPAVNRIQAGQVVELGFGLGGNQGVNVFAGGNPAVQRADCDTWAPIGAAALAATSSSGLSYNASSGTYTYPWKTIRAWRGTCRQFSLGLNDGSSHTLRFRFS